MPVLWWFIEYFGFFLFISTDWNIRSEEVGKDVQQLSFSVLEAYKQEKQFNKTAENIKNAKIIENSWWRLKNKIDKFIAAEFQEASMLLKRLLI